MKWRVVPKPKPDLTEWHFAFMWTPVRVGDFKYWLCFMWRRQIVGDYGLPEHGTFEWEYKEPSYV